MPMDVHNLNWMMMADEFSRWNAFRKKNPKHGEKLGADDWGEWRD
jgi:hypothetical protein